MKKVFIFLFSISFYTIAQPEVLELRRVIDKLKVVDESPGVKGYPCSNFIEQSSKKLLIIFDGKSSYSRKSLPVYQVLRDENMLSHIQTIYHNDLRGELGLHSELDLKLYTLFKKYIRDSRYPNFSANLILGYGELLNKSDLLHFPQRRPRKAFKCTARVLRNKKYDEISIVSYSHGTISAMKLIRQLSVENYKVNQLLTIDSIVKDLGVFKNLFGNKNSTVNWFDEKLVGHWVNFYQKDDENSFLVGGRGNSYPKADINERVKTLKKYGHGNIIRSIYKNKIFRDQVIDLLN